MHQGESRLPSPSPSLPDEVYGFLLQHAAGRRTTLPRMGNSVLALLVVPRNSGKSSPNICQNHFDETPPQRPIKTFSRNIKHLWLKVLSCFPPLKSFNASANTCGFPCGDRLPPWLRRGHRIPSALWHIFQAARTMGDHRCFEEEFWWGKLPFPYFLCGER